MKVRDGQQVREISAPLFDRLTPKFSGADYDEKRDALRLTGQLHAIVAYMRDAQWRTLQQIADATGAPHASVSAQLRNLRKPANGAHTVNRQHVGNGLYRYQLIVRRTP